MIVTLVFVMLALSLLGRHSSGAGAMLPLFALLVWGFCKLLALSVRACAWLVMLPLALLGVDGHRKRIG